MPFSAPTSDRVYIWSFKNAFFKALFWRQHTIFEKGRPDVTPKLNSVTKASNVFMCHFKVDNYEWRTSSTEHKLFLWRSFFLIRVKGYVMTDSRSLFTIDRWVLYYVMDIVSCTLLWRCTCCVYNTVVLLLWACRNFRVTWMCICDPWTGLLLLLTM